MKEKRAMWKPAMEHVKQGVIVYVVDSCSYDDMSKDWNHRTNMTLSLHNFRELLNGRQAEKLKDCLVILMFTGLDRLPKHHIRKALTCAFPEFREKSHDNIHDVKDFLIQKFVDVIEDEERKKQVKDTACFVDATGFEFKTGQLPDGRTFKQPESDVKQEVVAAIKKARERLMRDERGDDADR